MCSHGGSVSKKCTPYDLWWSPGHPTTCVHKWWFVKTHCNLIGIGTVPTTPWASYELDARGMVLKDDNGAPKLKGYCIEMIEEMAKRMNFDYEISLPSDNR